MTVSPGEVSIPRKKIRTLQDAIEYFSDSSRCVRFIALHRWPDGIIRCPYCSSQKVRFLSTRGLWECATLHPRSQFSVRSSTLFEDSHISLRDWLVAIWLVANSRSPVSSYQLSAHLGITQKSAWFMLRRIGVGLNLLGSSVPGVNQDLYGSTLRARSRARGPA
jgi:hypothetical protein